MRQIHIAVLAIMLCAVAACGEPSPKFTGKVTQSEWDGSVKQVENYLQEHLDDNRSYRSVDWSPLQKDSAGYQVRHRYRSANKYGGIALRNEIFTMDTAGTVLSVEEAPE